MAMSSGTRADKSTLTSASLRWASVNPSSSSASTRSSSTFTVSAIVATYGPHRTIHRGGLEPTPGRVGVSDESSRLAAAASARLLPSIMEVTISTTAWGGTGRGFQWADNEARPLA